jgi:hypothetical protein
VVVRLIACSLVAATALVTGAGCAEGATPPASEAVRDVAKPIAPQRPTAYRVPRHAVRVSTSAGLRAALGAHGRRSIVLAPGHYGGTGPFLNHAGHRIYAARLGAAVLEAGISIGASSGGSGGLVRGVVFSIRDPSRTTSGAAINIWGTATHSQVLDTVVRGHGVLGSGILARQPEALVVRRVVVSDVTDYGIAIDANERDRGIVRPGFRLTDADVSRVARTPPRSSDGTAEACIWIGNTGTVRRVRARSCAWAGLWTGGAALGVVFERIDIDDAPTGVYVEHFTHNSIFRKVRVGSRVRIGLLAEWADPAWNGAPASVDNVVEDSDFASSVVGVYLDEGTTRTTIRRSIFRRQSWAAIGDYRGQGNAYYDNDYRGLTPGASPVRGDHLATARDGPAP